VTVQQRLPSALERPIMFAHRGARAHAPENTMEAFALGLRLGATGIESDVWLTRDSVPVLDHDGVVGRRPRRRSIASLDRGELPAHVPALVELLPTLGPGRHLSLDLMDVQAADAVIDLVRGEGTGAVRRLWLCHHDVDLLTDLRRRHPDIHLVHSTRLARLGGGPERHAARLRAAAIDTINLRQPDWTGGLVTLFHRFDVLAFGWDMQLEHHLRAALRMGLDAVYSDHVDLMVDVYGDEIGPP
jgi:glycerophosphoryl diester phosphodiesterase